MKKNYKYALNIFIIIAITALSSLFLWKKGVFSAETFKNLSPAAIAGVSAVYFAHLCLNSLVNFLTVRSSISGWNYANAFSELVYGRLGSEITPFKSGHFPFRTLYFEQRGLPFFQAMTAFTQSQIIASAASVFNYFIIFIITLSLKKTLPVGDVNIGLWLISLVGLSFHIAAVALFLLLAFVKPLQKFFILTAAKITCRKKSDEEKNAFITEQTLKYEIYREQIKLMPKKTARYILPFFLYIADMFLSASSVYAAYLFSAGTIFSVNEYFSFYIATLAATYITNIIPIPGGSGSSEAAFLLIFSQTLGNSLAGTVLLVWRLGNFYMPIISESVFFAVVTVLNNRRSKKTDKVV